MFDLFDRRQALRAAQYTLAVVGLGWVLVQADWVRTVKLIGGIPMETVLALVGVTLVGLAFRFHMWHALIEEISHISRGTSAKIDLIVNFINHLLPSRLTGRGAAPYVIRKHTGLGWADTLAITGLHTGLYALLYGLGAVIGLAYGYHRLSLGLVGILFFASSLYLVAGSFLVVSGTRLGRIGELFERFFAWLPEIPIIGAKINHLANKAPRISAESADVFSRLLENPVVLASFAIGWIVAMLLAPGLRVWLLFEALGGNVSPVLALPFYLVAAYSVTVLPLTPGGIGVTEATATLVFTALGVPVDVIVPVVFIDRFMGVYLPALSGWYPSVRMGNFLNGPE